jgi:hypothetical protein
VHTDATTELAHTELDLLDDSQDVLPAFCKICNDLKINLRLIGRCSKRATSAQGYCTAGIDKQPNDAAAKIGSSTSTWIAANSGEIAHA